MWVHELTKLINKFVKNLFANKSRQNVDSSFQELADRSSSNNHFPDVTSNAANVLLTDKTDIIICVSGNIDLLSKCIDSIIKNTEPHTYQLNLVVHQKMRRVVEPYLKDNVRIFTHQMKNFNFARANNIVIKQSELDILLLNDDTEVTADWLEKLKYDSHGCFLTGARTNYQCSGNPDMWGEGESRNTTYPVNMFCAFIPRRIIQSVGLLDEEFCYYGGEDVDYSCRALKHGFPLKISSAFVIHKSNQSYGESKIPLMRESDKIIFERYGVNPPFNLQDIKPLVSIIIATHNRADLLPRAVNSIMDGLYKNTEIIIVDDGSVDNTNNVIQTLQKKFPDIISIKLSKSIGCVRARQKGFDVSTGDFIAFMDDDDFALPNRVLAPLTFMLHRPLLDVVYCQYSLVYPDGKTVLGNTREFNCDDYRNRKFDIGSGVMLIRRDVIANVPFMSTYDRAIDYDWVFRITRRGFLIDYCPANVLNYIRSNNPQSHLSGNSKSHSSHDEIQLRENLLNSLSTESDDAIRAL